MNLLLAPIKAYVSLFTALALPNFIPLFRSQTFTTRRALASEVAQSLLRNETKITNEEHLEAVMEILIVIIKENSPSPSGLHAGRRGQETDETVEEQGSLARIVHLIHDESMEVHYKVRFPSFILPYDII